jgi:hypothetical protein
MGRFLPFADLPQHVAVIATLRHWWDPAWKAQQTYSLSVGQTQYWLYYIVGALLAVPLKTSEMANRVLLTLVGLAFPYSLSSLLKAARRDERLAVFGCAFFWNKATLMGLESYVAAIPLTLWGLALAIRHSESPSRKRLALLAFISTCQPCYSSSLQPQSASGYCLDPVPMNGARCRDFCGIKPSRSRPNFFGWFRSLSFL